MKIQTFYIVMIIGLLRCGPVTAQTETISLVSHSYFIGMNLADSMMIEADFKIDITPKEVKIITLNRIDSTKSEVYLQRRTMSGIEYTTLAGETYKVWKLGDRKMVLREQAGRQYLSLYRTDDYGLPAEYITFVIEDQRTKDGH